MANRTGVSVQAGALLAESKIGQPCSHRILRRKSVGHVIHASRVPYLYRFATNRSGRRRSRGTPSRRSGSTVDILVRVLPSPWYYFFVFQNNTRTGSATDYP
eukprot:scaffold346215_cov36-Prasinocladus_malaysianus.AAC.1